MSDYTKNTKQIRPTEQYPGLVTKLARLAYLTKLLHKELTDEAVAKELGITKQGFNFHVKKEAAK